MNIDDIFKQSLEHHESEVNPNIWENISGEINQVDKTPIWSFGFTSKLLTSLIVLGSISLIGYLLLNNNHESTTEQQSSSEESIIIAQNNEKSHSSAAVNHEIKDSQALNAIDRETAPEKYIKSNLKTSEQVLDSALSANSTKIKKSVKKSSQSSFTTQSPNKQQTNTKSISKSITPLTSDEKDESLNLFGNLILNKEHKNSYVSIGTRNHLRNEVDLPTNAISPLKIEPFEIKRKAQECPSFYKNVWVPYMWAEYGSIFPQRTLSSEESYSDYLDLRNQYEMPEYSFDFGAGFGLMTPYGVYGEIGLQYSQIQEKFSFTDPETVKKTQIITLDTLFMNGQIITNSDTSYIDIPGAVTIVTHNKYKFFNFPIMLGYDHALNTNFSLGVKAGAILNFSFRQKGRFVDEDNNPVWFSSNTPGRALAFPDKIGMSFMTGLQATYHFGDLISLYFSPQIKFIPKSITLDDYVIRQTYLNPSLTIGVKYSIL